MSITNRIRLALLALGASAVLVAAGCGSGYHAKSTGASPPAAAHAKAPKAPSTAAPAAGIPQHNGGDQDADNNGGPSDGDGNL